MNRILPALTMLAALAALVASPAPASAQATHTFVSGTGNDIDPCSRTAPCLTFAGALSKTAAGGEINCLDPGGFGAVTINKSITIDCVGTLGGILVSGAAGVNVSTANVVVTLRNLTINGLGTGTFGINYTSGAMLHVDNCIIMNFNGSNGAGIRAVPSAGGTITVKNTTLINNGDSGSSAAGILIRSFSAVNINASLENVVSIRNTRGLFVDTSLANANIKVGLKDSVLAHNTGDGIFVRSQVASSPAVVMVENSAATHNNGIGVRVQGVGATIRLAGSAVTGNATGVSNSGGTLLSYLDNQIDANGINGTPLPPAASN